MYIQWLKRITLKLSSIQYKHANSRSMYSILFFCCFSGHPVSDLEQLEYEASLCCTPKNVGMLFFKHSLQVLWFLLLPNWHTTLFQRSSNVIWMFRTLDERLNNVGCQLGCAHNAAGAKRQNNVHIHCLEVETMFCASWKHSHM